MQPRFYLYAFLWLLGCSHFLTYSHSTTHQQSTDYAPVTNEEKIQLKEDVKEMFYHAYNNYMEFAFPKDELKPLSCEGRVPEGRGSLDDILGGFSLTLVDTLDSFVILNDFKEFERGLKLIVNGVTFNRDVTVSVFEITIRMLGGLLSIHLQAVKNADKLTEKYNNEILALAADLGNRLMPAFRTATGIPYSRVNLLKGIPQGETPETCTAGAGTLLLEFGLLSKLTGNPTYKNAARKAVLALWDRRSNLNMVGNVINVQTGVWTRQDSGIGAGIDSFFEYLYKSYILLGDDELLSIFNKAYSSVKRYQKRGPWYYTVNMHNSQVMKDWAESLSAFWPGLQASLGDFDEALATHLAYSTLWDAYSFLPEAYSVGSRQPVPGISHYPLRPEFAESTYLLYTATKNSQMLSIGRNIVRSLQSFSRVGCGYAAVSDVLTKRLEDRMDSFFLSETCKYLYLLFDEHNEVNEEDILFTTEGHIIPLKFLRGLAPINQTTLDSLRGKPKSKEAKSEEEKAEEIKSGSFQFTKPKKSESDSSNTHNKVDKENYDQHPTCSVLPLDYTPYNRHLNPFLNPSPTTQSKPKPKPKQQPQPQSQQQQQTLETLFSRATNIVGLPPGIQIKLVGGHLDTLLLNKVDIKDLNAMIQSNEVATSQPERYILVVLEILSPHSISRTFLASPATFGPELTFEGVQGELVLASPANACVPLNNPNEVKGKIVLVDRGICMFGEKVRNVMSNGAIGVIVADHGDNSEVFVMTDALDSKVEVTIPSILITNKHSKLLRKHLHDLKSADLQSTESQDVKIDFNNELCFKDANNNLFCRTPSDVEKHSETTQNGLQVKLRSMADYELGAMLQKAKEENTHKSLFENFAMDGLTDISNPNVLDKILQNNRATSTTTGNRFSEIAIEFDPSLFPDLMKLTQNQGGSSQEKFIRDLLAQLGGTKIGGNANVSEKEKDQKIPIGETNSHTDENSEEDEEED